LRGSRIELAVLTTSVRMARWRAVVFDGEEWSPFRLPGWRAPAEMGEYGLGRGV
jgi:hypothetical protein